MRTLVLAITAIALSLSSIACNKKKEGSKTRGGRGYHAGAAPGQSEIGVHGGQGWDALDQLPKSPIQNPNLPQDARDFLISSGVPEDQMGAIQDGVMAIAIARDQNGYIDTNRTRMGIVIWDDYAYQGAVPLTAYFGPEVQTQVDGQINQSNIDIRFVDEYGEVRVRGTMSGGRLQGEITYRSSNGAQRSLGRFNLPVNGVIF